MQMKGDITRELVLILFTILVVLAVFIVVVPLQSGDAGPKTPYDHIIKLASGDYMTETALIKAIIKVSSEFNASLSGERLGLMGITTEMIEDLGGGESSKHCDKMEVRDPLDTEENIKAGTCYFSYLLNRYNRNKIQALVAYHWDPGRLDGVGKDTEKAPAASRNFAKNVMEFYNDYKKAIGWDFEQ